jgi:hypothetical protein
MNRLEQEQMFERMTRCRDNALRKQLLTVLYELRITPSGWAPATALRDGVKGYDSVDAAEEREEYWIGLLRELCIKGLIEERQRPRKRGERFGLKHLEYRLLSRGLSLHLETAPPDPDIEDGRIVH